MQENKNVERFEDYVEKIDWRVKENSNTNYSWQGLQGHLAAGAILDWVKENDDPQSVKANEHAFIHKHDLSAWIVPYCSGWSAMDLLKEGFECGNNFIAAKPAKNLNTFLNQMVNAIFTFSGEFAGAQAFNSIDTFSAGFIKYNNMTDKEIEQAIQSFIFNLNVKTRIAMQAPFSNLSFDLVCPKDLAKQPVIIGGEEQDFTYGDCREEMDKFTIIFCEVMVQGDGKGKPFTFPIPTFSITNDFPFGSKLSEAIFTLANEANIPYFSNFINSDNDPGDVRSMALLGTQKLLYKRSDGKIARTQVSNIYENWANYKSKYGEVPDYQMLWNGEFVPVTEMFEIDYTGYEHYIKITYGNDEEQLFSWEHKLPVVRNGELIDVLSNDVLPGDKLLISRKSMQGNPIGDYQTGRMVGYYLAEGWVDLNDTRLEFAINHKRKDIVDEITSFFENMGLNVKVQREINHAIKVSVYGKPSVSLVKHFIDGSVAKEKGLSKNVWNTSFDFRRGLFDGYSQTDGYMKENCLAHTTNKQLALDLQDLCATLGIVTTLRVNNKNTRSFKEDKSDKVTFSSYIVRVISEPKVYNENYYLKKVKNVEKVKNTNIKRVFNFTVDTPEHLFTLPNGVVSHQCCRLRLDLSELRKKSGGLFGAGDKTGSIGVVTLNLSRMGYIAKILTDEENSNPRDVAVAKKILKDDFPDLYDEITTGETNKAELFFKQLDYFLDVAKNALVAKRRFCDKSLETGMLPYTKRYLGHFNNHFNTISVNSGHECCLNLFGKGIDDPDCKKFMQGVLDYILEKCQSYQEENPDILYNLEAAPAESCGTRFAKSDRKDFEDIVTGEGTNGTFYTNSTMLPESYSENIFAVCEHQDGLIDKYTGGSVIHIYMNEPLPSWQIAENLIRKIFTNYKIPYMSISPDLCICPIHGRLPKSYDYCPYEHKQEDIDKLIEQGVLSKEDVVFIEKE